MNRDTDYDRTQHIGRPQGFAGAAISMALANLLYATCRNVETYLVCPLKHFLNGLHANIE